ncbi:MAG: hypothetical protein U9R02_04560 [Thermodesulfobacteriota bacterium]|nr:hypothetical protein [Thermodesulfobacteriota bacterium]
MKKQDLEQDNLMLDKWFQKNHINTRDLEFDTTYVNGSNNLPNLKLDDENWNVRLLEEEFIKRMWDVDVRTISEHLKNIYEQGEVMLEATIRKFRIVQKEGGRKAVKQIESSRKKEGKNAKE